MTLQFPAHGQWHHELPSGIREEKPGQKRQRLLKPWDLGCKSKGQKEVIDQNDPK